MACTGWPFIHCFQMELEFFFISFYFILIYFFLLLLLLLLNFFFLELEFGNIGFHGGGGGGGDRNTQRENLRERTKTIINLSPYRASTGPGF